MAREALPQIHLTDKAALLPLYPHLLGLRPGGVYEARLLCGAYTHGVEDIAL